MYFVEDGEVRIALKPSVGVLLWFLAIGIRMMNAMLIKTFLVLPCPTVVEARNDLMLNYTNKKSLHCECFESIHLCFVDITVLEMCFWIFRLKKLKESWQYVARAPILEVNVFRDASFLVVLQIYAWILPVAESTRLILSSAWLNFHLCSPL